ncbi:DUF803 domain protein [Aspergillus mulundensis]|uniref:DUF803 domain protein n=1 Tax=Aspergillus mulundensis TaxID=1810919 RepID=A0A3D8RFJ2_9EURO|nr:Uncharacterized protein DSM5745_07816 [Aspergillus mulundensis]RDW72644.1 Uncharacterized protein DSM5745_07816 [Aspergillus mulundensis]
MGNLGDLSPQGSVASALQIGVLVGLISTSLQAIGLTLQRKSHLLEDEKHPYELRRPPFKRRRWQLGMMMFVVSNIVGSTIQITTLPLPVLSTLQASGLVFNTVFATLILGEAFTRYSLIGTLLVCAGAVLIAVFGAIGEPAHTLNQLLVLLRGRGFILWVAGTVMLSIVIFAGSKVLQAVTSRSKHPTLRSSYAPRLNLTHNRVRLIRGLCYGMISGILSAHTLLLAKSAVELLVRTIVDRHNQFNRWQSWVILLLMVSLALLQLYYLHLGLKLCSTSILYPFVFCIYNVIAILDGLIYFRQVSRLTKLHAGLVALGTVILLGGVLCLSWRLEDIDSHTMAVSGPSQAAIGPGMAAIDETTEGPVRLDLDDEEERIGEREPLLRPRPLQESTRQRAPSLPLYATMSKHKRTSSTNMDPASIWAELEDSDIDIENAPTGARSSLLTRFSIDPIQTRPRSKSGAPFRFSSGSGSGSGWSLRLPRRFQNDAASSRSQPQPQPRRTSFSGSGPGPEQRLLLPKRRALTTLTGYGTASSTTSLPESGGHYQYQPENTSPDSRSATGRLLAGSRNALGAWRTGMQYLARLTGTGAGTGTGSSRRSARERRALDSEANHIPPTTRHHDTPGPEQ